MLFVSGKDQGIQYFATGNGRIISQVRIDQPGAIFQLRIGGQNKTDCFYTIKYPASMSDDSIYQFTAFTDLGCCILQRN